MIDLHLALRRKRRRKSKTLFEHKQQGRITYVPTVSSLSESQKKKIRKQVTVSNYKNWINIIKATIISTVIAYLILSLVSSMFLGEWIFF